MAWKGSKLYIPLALQEKVLHRSHDVKQAGHFGFLKMLHYVKRQFWWPRMKASVEDYVKRCPICTTVKHQVGKPLGLLQEVVDPTRPWQDIAMDFIVKLPESNCHTVIWTVIGLFSKQAHFVPCSGLPSA